MKKLTIYVDNMVCDSCAKVVSDEINRVQAEAETVVDVSKGQVVIKSSREILSSDIILALEKIGYPKINKR